MAPRPAGTGVSWAGRLWPRRSGTGTGSAATKMPYRTQLEQQLAELEQQGTSPQTIAQVMLGSQQLWWKCCREAVDDPGWLAGTCAESIRCWLGKTTASSGWTAAEHVPAVVDSAYLIAQALSTTPDSMPSRADALAWVAAQWAKSGLLLLPSGTGLVSSTGIPAAQDDLAARLDSLIGALSSQAVNFQEPSEPARAMVAVTALLLAGVKRSSGRTVRVSVVFGLSGKSGSAEQGAAGFLELREFPAGPAGLFPDPQAMAGASSNGPAFAESLAHAWQSAQGRTRGRCVLWRISLPDDPFSALLIEGGSLGAAFALALRELFRHPHTRRPTLAWVQGFFYGPRPKTAVTGRIDDSGHLRYVTDMGSKLQVAHMKRWLLVAPEENQADLRQAPDPRLVKFAATITQAERYLRQWRIRRLAAATAVIALAAATGVAITYQVAVDNRQQTAIRISQNLGQFLASQLNATSLSSASLGPVPPDVYGLLAVDAYRIAPTQQADQALFDSFAQLSPYQAVIGSYPGDNESVSIDRAGTTAVVSESTSVDVWQIPSNLPRRHLSRHIAGLTGAAISPDGTRMAGTSDGRIQLWQTDPLRVLREIPVPVGATGFQFTNAPILAFSTDHRYIGILSGEFSLFIWDTVSGHLTEMQVPSSADEPFSTIGFTGSGAIYAAAQGGDATYSWNPVTSRVTRMWHGVAQALPGDSPSIAASCTRGLVHAHWIFIEPATGQRVQGLPLDLPCQEDSIAEALNSNFLATVRPEDTLKSAPANQAMIASVINLRTRKVVAQAGLDSDSIVGLSPSGRRMFVQGASFGIALLTPPGGPIAHTDSTVGYTDAESPNKRFIAQPINPGISSPLVPSPEIKIINAATGAPLHTLMLPIGRNSPDSANIGEIDNLAFLPDGTLLTMAAGEISLWNVRTGAMTSPPVTLVVNSDTASRSSLADLGLAVDPAAANEIAMIGPNNNTIELWRVGRWHLLRAIGPVNGSIDSTEFSPDGRSIVVTTDSGLAEVFSTTDGARLSSMPLPDHPSATSVAVLAHGYVALVGLSALSIWQGNTEVAHLSAPTGLILYLAGIGAGSRNLIIQLSYASNTAASSVSEPFEISPNPASWASQICTVIDRGLSTQELSIPGPGIPNQGCLT
jgi:WD40 repeat protein